VIIRVSELEEGGVTVDQPAALAGAFSDPAWRLDRVRLQITPDGRDVIVHGTLAATVPQTCGRCTEAFPALIEADVDLRLEPRPSTGDSVELGADDLDVDFYTDDQIDLRRIVENETTLALPMKPLCHDGCRGLCAVCGANRNLTPCGCEQRPPDERLAALGEFRARLTS
jgi:DUF177 domain-containing protein